MGKITSLRDLLGLIKDKASISKAALLCNPNALTIRLAVLRATTHAPHAPPGDRSLTVLLFHGDSSRATASLTINALMDRLHRTGNCTVALKCLLIIHHIIKRGPFILQDQLSIFPTNGGYNYLKLTDFRDGATATTWALSSWVRWYGRYLETLLATSRVLGYFLSCSVVKENQEQRISSFLNVDVIKDVNALTLLIEEICKAPVSIVVDEDIMVKEIMGLLLKDYLSSVNEILLRLSELKERLSCLSFTDSVEIMCGLKRMEDCRERVSNLYVVNKPSVEMMWGLVQELKDRVGMLTVYREGGKVLTLWTRERATESARFHNRVFGTVDSVKFHSGRFGINIK